VQVRWHEQHFYPSHFSNTFLTEFSWISRVASGLAGESGPLDPRPATPLTGPQRMRNRLWTGPTHAMQTDAVYKPMYAPESSFIVDKIYNNGSQTLFTPACVGPLSVHLASTRLRVMVIYLLRNQLLTNKRILIDLCIKSV